MLVVIILCSLFVKRGLDYTGGWINYVGWWVSSYLEGAVMVMITMIIMII